MKRQEGMDWSKLANALHRMVPPDSFVWWAVLAISMLSLPTYVVVMAYGISYENQVAEILILALSCTISIYIGVHIHGMVHDGFYDFENAMKATDSRRESTVRNLEYQSLTAEYEQYINKINILNENTYTTNDGSTVNLGYSRSCDYNYNDV